MPEVLSYASSRTGRRLNEQRDWDLFGLSLVQISLWIWFAFQGNLSGNVRGDRWSLFAFAWGYNEAGLGDAAFCILLYVLVAIATLSPADRRIKGYRACVAVLTAGIILDTITRQYLMVQCFGAWGVLLTRERTLFDRLHLWLLMQPVSLIALIRALTPIKWESTTLELFAFQLRIVLVVGVIVIVAVMVPAW